ncbi:ead/Ea22-like family protein [Enterobacter sp. ESY66]
MSNIDKQALREIAAAAVGAHERLSVMPHDDIFDISLAEGTQLDADITALNALNSAANPATVLAMLDELEAKDKRIAELEAREVRLTDINEYLAEVHDKTLNRAFRLLAEGVRAGDVAAMRAAGINIAAAGKGEAA